MRQACGGALRIRLAMALLILGVAVTQRVGLGICVPGRCAALQASIAPLHGGSRGDWQFLRKLDASTKWLVTLAQTTAVVVRRDTVSPYTIIGGIAAAFFTTVIKRLINQRRPAGSPLTDPGMPSSHALVATFTAAAWASLRVACGHHTWAQVVVGASLGTLMGCAWMAAGVAWVLPRRDLVFPVYAIYLFGSVVFVTQQLTKGKIGRR
eukprot:CAMPEP_0179155552 /NCGR_PEP_ID=MMETSP0796-20121207/75779_1 /TAXON_ID=73915 /ORGANISM="Pyrodinium bahamense, Strain pbaha01" /LENGTH=208 /DNA_ID=CAMNT_0020857047 /DNA_START=44 /DNA_END=667 /DNA_ORIENTATION=+